MGGKCCPKCHNLMNDEVKICDDCGFDFVEAEIIGRLEMKKNILISGNELYSKCLGSFKFIIGDLLEANKQFADEEWDYTITQDQVLRQGFTDNQVIWIQDVIKQLSHDDNGGKVL